MVSGIFNVFCSIVELVWACKTQILGGLFLALTYYCYFYRELIRVKKERLRQAKKIGLINKWMEDIKAKTREELEHDSINSRINTVIVQMNSNFEVVGQQLENILTETKKTNGRVTKLEDSIAFLTVIKKNKWLIGFIFLGIMKAYDLVDVQKILNFFF